MNLLALQGLKGSELVQELMYEVNGRDYVPDGRVWECANSNMRLMLWNLAGLNDLQYNVQFKKQWLALPIEIKRELGAAIRELHRFVKQCDVVYEGAK